MSIKKSLLLLCFLGTATTLNAAESTDTHFRSGVYVGVMEGLSVANTKVSESFIPDPLFVATNQSASKSLSRSAFVSEIIFVGRYLLTNGFFPGFEVSASFANHKLDQTFTFNDPALVPVAPNDYLLKFAFKRRYSIVPSVVLGWALNKQFNIFTKLGLGITKYDVRIQNDTEAPFFQHSTGKTKYSFVPSLGVEYSFSRYVSLIATVTCDVGAKPELNARGFFDIGGGVPADDQSKLSGRMTVFSQKIGLLFKF